MSLRFLITSLVVPLGLATQVAPSLADRDDITFQELPAAVQERIAQLVAPDAQIKEIELEHNKKAPGEAIYEIEYRVQKVEWELELSAKGDVLKHERDD